MAISRSSSCKSEMYMVKIHWCTPFFSQVFQLRRCNLRDFFAVTENSSGFSDAKRRDDVSCAGWITSALPKRDGFGGQRVSFELASLLWKSIILLGDLNEEATVWSLGFVWGCCCCLLALPDGDKWPLNTTTKWQIKLLAFFPNIHWSKKNKDDSLVEEQSLAAQQAWKDNRWNQWKGPWETKGLLVKIAFLD